MPVASDAHDPLLAAYRDLERAQSRLASLRGNLETAATGGLRVGDAAAVVGVAVEHARVSFELFFPAVRVEKALDLLLDASWVTPGQVLAGPQPSLRKILVACEDRLKARGPGTAERLTEVRDLLQRAIRVEESGRRGREKLRKAARRARRPECAFSD